MVTNRSRALPSRLLFQEDLDKSSVLCSVFKDSDMAQWLSWLERRPVTAEVAGSSPAGVAFLRSFCKIANGVLAQLGEHLPYKQRVTGSSPVGPSN